MTESLHSESGIPVQYSQQEIQKPTKAGAIVTNLSGEAQIKLEVIQALLERCVRSHNLWRKVEGSSPEAWYIGANGTKIGQKVGARWFNCSHSNE